MKVRLGEMVKVAKNEREYAEINSKGSVVESEEEEKKSMRTLIVNGESD